MQIRSLRQFVKNLLNNEIFSLPFSLRSFTRCHSGISVPRRSQGSSGLSYKSFTDCQGRGRWRKWGSIASINPPHTGLSVAVNRLKWYSSPGSLAREWQQMGLGLQIFSGSQVRSTFGDNRRSSQERVL
jgi:hypothetical protein